MIRKRIALFFVLFATLLLLVHAVVPHHHHKDHVCISIHHCQSDGCAHEHGTPVSDHPHEGGNDSEFCVLKQAVFIPSSQWNQFDKYGFGTDKPFFFLDFQALVYDNGWKTDGPGIVLSGYESSTPLICYDFTVSSTGLRAPPVV